MIILIVRTDNPTAESGLYDDERQIAVESWQAHRQLSETIHTKIAELLNKQKIDWADIGGIVFYGGPGSFTGLRIGASVVNGLSNSLEIPLAQSSGKRWIEEGIESLIDGKRQVAAPDYGAEPRVSKPVK